MSLHDTCSNKIESVQNFAFIHLRYFSTCTLLAHDNPFSSGSEQEDEVGYDPKYHCGRC